MAAFTMSASALSARVTTPRALKASGARRGAAAPARRALRAPARAQAVVAPPAGGDSEPPKPRTEAFR